MIITIISDTHLSKNDIKLTETNSHNVYDSLIWADGVAKENNSDIVLINGDFLDKDVLDSETNTLISDFFNQAQNKKYLFLLGNHEMMDADGNYNSLNILKNYKNVEVITKLKTLSSGDKTLVFQPYTKKVENINELLQTLSSNKNNILFSHLTYDNVPGINSLIKGELDYLAIRDKVNKIFNGHIHIGLEADNNKYIQIGTITGLNFSDNYNYSKPGIIIYDTENDTFKRIENPNSYLYITATPDNIDNIQNQKRVHLRIECKYSDIEKLKDKLDSMNFLSYEFKITVNDKKEQEDKIDFNLFDTPEKALKQFIQIDKSIYDENQLVDFIETYLK